MLFPNIEDFASRAVVTVRADAHVREAIDRMVNHNIRDVIVLGEEEREFGIFTAADLIRLRAGAEDLDCTMESAGFRRLPTVPAGINILEALTYFGDSQEYVCVVGDDGRLRGIVSHTDLVTGIDPQVMIERQCVGDLIIKNQLKTVGAEATLGDALFLLHEASDAVIVMRDGKPAGVITTKDAVRLISGGVALDDPVAEHMTVPLQSVPARITIRGAMDYLREKHFKRLVVHGDDGSLLGVVTQRELVAIAYSRWADLMRNHALELREMVDLLERKTARLEQIAATDRLTGVANRARFEDQLGRELERFGRYRDGECAVVMIDIDHFKFVNDTWGHLRGDEVLKAVAQLLAGHLRGIDTFARWGGEEFAALLPHTNLEEALHTAERLRRAVEGETLDGSGSITISGGVAVCHAGESAQDLVARADRALYRAKQGGRNRIEAG